MPTTRHVSALHAVVAVALAFVYALSYAALIFSGPMGSGFSAGVFSALIAVAVVGLIVASFSRFSVAIATPDSNPSAVLALVAVSLSILPVTVRVPTMLAVLVLATAATGAVLLAFGTLRASRIMRFVPEPMIGGFNAASGTLVMLGAQRVLGAHLISPKGAAAFAMALAILLAQRRFGGLGVAVLFCASIAVMPLAALVSHVPLDHFRAHGWLFAMPHASPVFSWSFFAFPVDLRAVLLVAPQVLIIAIIGAVTLLLNATGVELLTGIDADLDRELRLTGIANMVSALFGGMIAYMSFSRTSMMYELGSRGRGVGIVMALVAVVAVVAGPWHAINAIPVFAPAGLLLAMGVGIAYRWLIGKNVPRSRGDVITVWTIVIVVVWFGFVAGVVAGLAAGCITFVVRYAKIDSVAHRWSGRSIRSALYRSAHESEVLTNFGERVRIFKLRGFMFFGSADRLYRELLACAAGVDGILWIVVDFSGVTGMDSSAAAAFAKFARNVDADRVQFMVCGMTSPVAAVWNARLDGDARPLAFDDLDLALEYCESQLLLLFDSYAVDPVPLDYWLVLQFGGSLAEVILPALERLELDTGDVLCTQGELADRMFIVERGRVAVLVGEEHIVRVRSIGSLAVVGEMGLYEQTTRTATVVAEIPTVVHALSRDALDHLESNDPLAASQFHSIIVRSLGERLEQQNQVIASLSA